MPPYRLKKLSITQKQAHQIIKLVKMNLTGRNIAIKLKISQPTLWRNMDFMGLNKKAKNKKA